MSPRIKPLLELPILFAHRGGPTQNLAENSLEAFRRSLDMGNNAWGLETDIWLTQDGMPLLNHDKKISAHKLLPKFLGKPISELDSSALPGSALTLERFFKELINEFGNEFELSIDIKDASAIQKVVEISEKNNAKPWICHPDFELLQKWRSQWPNLRLVHSFKLSQLNKGLEIHLRDLSEAGINAMNLAMGEYSMGLASLIHRFEVLAFAWGANHLREIIELLNMGVDAVYGDSPEHLLAARNEVYG